MPAIFDSHCHYDDDAFDDDRLELISKLLGTSVDFLMHASVDAASSEFGIKMAEKFQGFYTSIGFHPENLDDLPADYLSFMSNLLTKCDKIKAVGEIGLDYHYDGYNRYKQIEVFEAQLDFARQNYLPVIIHSRNANDDMMKILHEQKPRGVMHCFSGSVEMAREVVELGMYIGFTGVLSFKNSRKAKKAAEACPMDRILLETDCPYMAPEPFRGRRCDSSMIDKTAAALAEIKGLTVQETIDICSANAKRLFKI